MGLHYIHRTDFGTYCRRECVELPIISRMSIRMTVCLRILLNHVRTDYKGFVSVSGTSHISYYVS